MDLARTFLFIYIIFINVASLSACGADKYFAHRHKRRISEKALITFSVLGGAAGMLLGMLIFSHKTRKPKFFIGIPAILTVQIALLLYLQLRGVL